MTYHWYLLFHATLVCESLSQTRSFPLTCEQMFPHVLKILFKLLTQSVIQNFYPPSFSFLDTFLWQRESKTTCTTLQDNFKKLKHRENQNQRNHKASTSCCCLWSSSICCAHSMSPRASDGMLVPVSFLCSNTSTRHSWWITPLKQSRVIVMRYICCAHSIHPNASKGTLGLQ